jgi:hypothetical protein
MRQDACQTKASGEAIFLPLGKKKLQSTQKGSFLQSASHIGSAREAGFLVEGQLPAKHGADCKHAHWWLVTVVAALDGGSARQMVIAPTAWERSRAVGVVQRRNPQN